MGGEVGAPENYRREKSYIAVISLLSWHPEMGSCTLVILFRQRTRNGTNRNMVTARIFTARNQLNDK